MRTATAFRPTAAGRCGRGATGSSSAFNDNLPFDQFTVEQIAGDLLPNATRDQIVATGFNRNHRLNGEGGIIAEEWRIENVIDRVETTSFTWLGLTMNCCRCHDHKYDPITQKEFYPLFAFFNNVPEKRHDSRAVESCRRQFAPDHRCADAGAGSQARGIEGRT